MLQAKENGLFVGLAADLIDKGVAILKYAYNTVLCLTHDPDKAVNVKLLLYLLELMSGLKINFLKSEVLIVRGDNDISQFNSGMFNCHVGVLPLKYLGMHVTFS